LLLEKVKPLDDRRWNLAQALAQGWSRATQMLMIDSQAHDRWGVGASNFSVRLLAPQSELVPQALTDVESRRDVVVARALAAIWTSRLSFTEAALGQRAPNPGG
jgi:predicted nuclease of restriction endonuclease-like (RecB) superfamily